ncbi:MAG: TonB-dependent receptor plug domain-containing protein, partial [Rikenellaceae bacterium]|nr:TonB-dependent receptor plug domain-containing protein [Rikenellaceae bacterium]
IILIKKIVYEKSRLFYAGLFWMLFSGIAWAQNVTVSGTVTDAATGEPISYATVSVQGTTLGTATDEQGFYSITVPPGRELTFSFVGYQTVREPVGNRVRIDIGLRSEATVLDEVIVVAYGTTTRASFTGSASVVSADQLETRSLTNLASGLEGNASGVQVTAAHGQPGESASIRIRGFGSYGASNSPLYVVDGAVYNGDLSSINPNDIASMTILKDAQSTALYGSSAGNGVVLITTKKGTSTKGTISFNVSQGISDRAYKDYKAVNIWEYYPLQWEMLKNGLISTGETAADAASQASARIVETLGGYNPYAGVANDQVVDREGNLTANSLK